MTSCRYNNITPVFSINISFNISCYRGLVFGFCINRTSNYSRYRFVCQHHHAHINRISRYDFWQPPVVLFLLKVFFIKIATDTADSNAFTAIVLRYLFRLFYLRIFFRYNFRNIAISSSRRTRYFIFGTAGSFFNAD